MFNSTFKIVYFVGVIIASIVRKYYTSKYRKLASHSGHKTITDVVLLGFTSLGMIVPLIYVLSSVLDFANFLLPSWVGWTGAAVFCFFIWLLWRSHVDLGKCWTPLLQLRENHQLIKSGVFAYIRHPMYAAHWLWAIAQILLLHNWIAGFSFFVCYIPHYLYRVHKEEAMMLQRFGAEYKAYMLATGRLFPRLRKLYDMLVN